MAFQPDNLGQQLFDARMKAHDVLQEHLKQIITIASATLALTVSFLKDVVGSEGERASWVFALPVSWACLGASIACSIWAIAVLVNNLDWAKKPYPARDPTDPAGGTVTLDRSYAAGAKPRTSVPVFLSNLSFAVGMASLGLFAAWNYNLFLHRVKPEYKVSSASEAVAQARTQLPKDVLQMQVNKAELIKGVSDLPATGQVWHVQLQYEILTPQTLPSEGKESSSARVQQKSTKVQRRTSSLAPVPEPKSRIVMSDFFFDAKTGQITRVP